MNGRIAQALVSRFGPAVAAWVQAVPVQWRSTARRRRFLFLAVCAPGFITAAALPFHKGPLLFLAGTAWVLVVAGLRSLSEPSLITGGNLD